VPGRHPSDGGGFFDGFGEGAGGFVGEERHGRGLAGAMAALAILLQDGEYVFVERNLQGVRCRQRGDG
jgi:hypothetical protein